MLLRSSSTPVIGTLLSAFSDSPNRDFDNLNNNNNNSNNGCTKHPPIFYHSTTKLSSSHGVHHLNLNSFSCSSSPISLSASGFSEFDRQPNSLGLGRFRRTRSDGNLKGLTTSSCDIDEFCNPNTPTRCSLKTHKAMLKTAPSFSIFNSVDEFEGEEENDEVVKRDGCLERSITIGDHLEAIGSGEFSFGKDNNMGLIKEDENEEEEGINGFQSLGIEVGVEPVSRVEPVSPSMYLATGLGIDGAGFGGGGGSGGGYFGPAKFDEGDDVEEYYKRMVVQDPCNPLFVRNYAQLLQSKGDLHRAEEYYFRATLADPGDGEILLQYAKLVWELHHDQDRALSYFERAAQAAPEDSYAHAAYASFLWEIEDGKAEDNTGQGHIQIEEEEGLNELHKSAYKEENEPVSPSLHLAAGLGIDVAGFDSGTGVVEFITNSGEGGIVEEYYKRMVEENPCNPLFLRNYAQFLCQSKGDLQGAEEFYSRAILADPGDGEIMSQYAKLVWELHHDQDKALGYFEQAVQATPGDSHILAAYASFLWETEDDEEKHSIREDQIQVPLFHGGVLTSANA